MTTTTCQLAAMFLVVLMLGSCEKPEMRNSGETGKAESAPKPFSPSYPVKRLLTNSEGTAIDATVIGRSSSEVMIVRLLDQKRFSFPISKLSPKDQEWIRSLPLHSVSMPSTPVQRGEKNAPETELRASSLVEKRLIALDEEIAGVREEMRDHSYGSIKLRSLKSQLDRLLSERAESARELQELQ